MPRSSASPWISITAKASATRIRVSPIGDPVHASQSSLN
jgi:hypothetical protein